MAEMDSLRSSGNALKLPGSLSDLKEIGCKSVWTVHISPLFRAIERLLAFKIVKICPRPVTFSLRFFKSDRLLGASRKKSPLDFPPSASKPLNLPFFKSSLSLREREEMQPILRQKGGVTLFTLLLIIFAASMAYWLWRAHADDRRDFAFRDHEHVCQICVGQLRYRGNRVLSGHRWRRDDCADHAHVG